MSYAPEARRYEEMGPTLQRRVTLWSRGPWLRTALGEMLWRCAYSGPHPVRVRVDDGCPCVCGLMAWCRRAGESKLRAGPWRTSGSCGNRRSGIATSGTWRWPTADVSPVHERDRSSERLVDRGRGRLSHVHRAPRRVRVQLPSGSLIARNARRACRRAWLSRTRTARCRWRLRGAEIP